MRPKPPKALTAVWENDLAQDISQNLLTMLRNNTGMSTEAAMRKVTMDMLANNPFVPPTTGCPINDLPNELLAYIFLLGTQMEEDDDGSDVDEEEESEYIDALDLGEAWEDVTDDEDEDMEVHNKKLGGKAGKRKEEVPENHENEDMAVHTNKNSGKKVGKRIETTESDEDDDEEDEESCLPFQVLVSHVCQHWREIALESPVLWTKLTFTDGPPFEKSIAWIQRSKGSPLDISIDCTIPENDDYAHDDQDSDSESDVSCPSVTRKPGSHGEKYEEEHGDCHHGTLFYSLDDLNTILDIIVPYVAQWRLLDFSVSYYVYMYTLLSRLTLCSSAPLLEVLILHHYEEGNDTDGEEEFQCPELSTPVLIFNGIAPNLKEVTLWGVHLDWERSLSFLAGLQDFELAYHAKNVRPSFATFSKLLAASPEIRTLTLCMSGPAEDNDMDNDWGTDPIEVLSLKDLVLCYHEPKYIIALMRLLCAPNVTSLVLDYDGADYSEFVQALTRPMPGKNKSLLAGLEHLKIVGLPCNNKSAEMLLDQLAGLQSLNLNCQGEEEELFFDLLCRLRSKSKTPYCPNLHTIWTTGIHGRQMKTFIEMRRVAGMPIKRVGMSQQDEIGEREESWIKDHVETLEFFEPSDSEEDVMDVDIDMELDDDM
jgi:F-box-like